MCSVLKSLRILEIGMGGFTDTGMQALTGLTALRSLSLQYCHNITDRGLKSVVVPLSRLSLARVTLEYCGKVSSGSLVGHLYTSGCMFITAKVTLGSD